MIPILAHHQLISIKLPFCRSLPGGLRLVAGGLQLREWGGVALLVSVRLPGSGPGAVLVAQHGNLKDGGPAGTGSFLQWSAPRGRPSVLEHTGDVGSDRAIGDGCDESGPRRAG